MPILKTISAVVRRYFLSGVLVVVPLIITYVVLRFFFDTVDDVLRPVLNKLLGHDIPGLGIAATLVLIFLAGIFTRNIIGHQLLKWWNHVLERLPFVRPIYSSARQLLQATTDSEGSFKDVAMIEYPRRGAYCICFVTQFVELDFGDEKRKFVSVFLPSAPTPMTGWTLLVPLDDVVPLDLTVEQAITYCVSVGVVVPSQIRRKGKLEWKKSGEVTSETG